MNSKQFIRKYYGMETHEMTLSEFEDWKDANEVGEWDYPLNEADYVAENNIECIAVRFLDGYRLCEIENYDLSECEKMEWAMDFVMDIINFTKASGNINHNPLIDLRVIERKGCKDMCGNPLRDGLFVRPVYLNNPDRNDGYYDICVEGDSPWGAVLDVMNNLQHKF